MPLDIKTIIWTFQKFKLQLYSVCSYIKFKLCSLVELLRLLRLTYYRDKSSVISVILTHFKKEIRLTTLLSTRDIKTNV